MEWTPEEQPILDNFIAKSPLKIFADLKSHTGLAMEWTTEEQTILDNWLAKLPISLSVSNYAKISLDLPYKTTRDVAIRCRWMNNLGKVKVMDSNLAPQDKLLNENEELFNQISANLTSSSNLKENITLFDKASVNIMKLVNELNENVPDQMMHMPPLPGRLRMDLFDQIYHN